MLGMLGAVMVWGLHLHDRPDLEGIDRWREFLGNTWYGFGFCLLMIVSGDGLVVLPGWLARWHKRQGKIQDPKPGPVDDLA